MGAHVKCLKANLAVRIDGSQIATIPGHVCGNRSARLNLELRPQANPIFELRDSISREGYYLEHVAAQGTRFPPATVSALPIGLDLGRAKQRFDRVLQGTEPGVIGGLTELAMEVPGLFRVVPR